MKKFMAILMVVAIILPAITATCAEKPRNPENPGGANFGSGPQNPGGARGPEGRFVGRGGRRRGRMIQERLANNPAGSAKLEEITELKQELKKVRKELQELNWKRTQDQLKKIVEENPEKKEKVDQLLELRKRMTRHQERLGNMREKARNLAKELELPPGIMRSLAGRPPEQMGGSPLARRIERQMMRRRRDMRPEEPPLGPKPGQQFEPQHRPPPPGPQHTRRPRGEQGEQFKGRMQRRRTAFMEKLADEDPERYELMKKQSQIRDQLRNKIDELTDLLVQDNKSNRYGPGKWKE